MNKETANKVLAHFEAMFTSGNEVLYLINNSCPDEVRRRYQEVLGRVVSEIDLELLEPIYKQFPDLRPTGMDEIRGG